MNDARLCSMCEFQHVHLCHGAGLCIIDVIMQSCSVVCMALDFVLVMLSCSAGCIVLSYYALIMQTIMFSCVHGAGLCYSDAFIHVQLCLWY